MRSNPRASSVQAAAMAWTLVSLAACNSGIEVGNMTTGGTSGAAASGTSGGGRTTGGSTTGEGRTTGGRTSGGTSTGPSTTGGTTGQAIGEPAFAATGGIQPDPCEVDFDFGNLSVGLTSSETFTADNIGNGVLDVQATDAFLDPAFDARPTRRRHQSSPAAGHFQFSVSFSPSTNGLVTSTFDIPTDGVNPGCPGPPGASTSFLTVVLSGTGVLPCLKVQPTTLDFGTTLINTTSKKSVMLTNMCAAAVTGIGSMIAGGDANLFTVDNAPTMLDADASATVDLSYSPLALENRSLASVTFSDSNSQKATLNLFGEPVGVALTVAPNPINCGAIAASSTAICCTTVTDQANVAVDINGVGNFADAAGVFGIATTDAATPPNPIAFPIALAAGGSAEVCFTFTPATAEKYTGQATLETTDPSGTNPIIKLMGTGTE